MNLSIYGGGPGSTGVGATGRVALAPEFGPLAGVRVLDTGRFVAGPWAASYLAEFGAEVIHLEGTPFHAPYADPTRTLPPMLPEGATAPDAVSESWIQYSRNKLSVGVDLRSEEGRRIFLDLVRVSEIWIESSRPGSYAKLGLDDATVQRANPALAIVHVSGFGQTGEPDRVRAPSFDLVGQAFSGFLALQGAPEPGAPVRAGTALNDTVTGLAAAGAAVMAHLHTLRTGRGQVVDVAQYEVFFTLLENLALDYFMRGVVRGRYGNAHARLHPYELLRARDGFVVLAAPTADAWGRLRPLLGPLPPEAEEMTWRTGHRAEVDPALERFCAERTVDELESIGREHDLAIARVLDIAGIARDGQYRARGMFEEWTDPVAGRVKGAGIAPKFSASPGRIWRGAPWLGQDNERVLGELLGYDAGRIAGLYRTGAVGRDPPSGARRPRAASSGREAA